MEYIDIFEPTWIHHTGTKCPIPWAQAGEYEIIREEDNHRNAVIARTRDAASLVGWRNKKITHWRLTNGWIPVIGGRCPEAIGWKKGEWEYRIREGGVTTALNPPSRYNFNNLGPCGIVAVRLIKEEVKPLKQDARGTYSISAKDVAELQDRFLKPIDTVYFNIFNTDDPQEKPPEAYLRFRASPRGKEALAMIGKAEEPRFKPLGEDAMLNIFSASLTEFEAKIERKKQ